MSEQGSLAANFSRVAVTVQGKAVDLTWREFLLLKEMISHRNRVLSRNQLIERLWPENRFVKLRTVDVHVGRLRTKLGPVSN